MPGIFATTEPSRRRFLQGTVQAAACAVYAPLHAAVSEGTRRWALLADTHVAADPGFVSRGGRPYAHLESAVLEIKKRNPAGAMIVGDVAYGDGQPGDYEAVKTLLQPLADDVPVFLGLGNHDDRETFKRVFSGSPSVEIDPLVKEKHVVVIDQAPIVRLVLLDSLLNVDQAPGELGQAQRNWLTRYLEKAGADVPVVIAVHHTLGRGGGDLQDVARFFEIIDSAPQVKAVFYGHSHRFQFSRRKGVHLVNLPPVGYAFDGVTPLGWLDAEFSSDGVVLTLRALDSASPHEGSRRMLEWRPGGG